MKTSCRYCKEDPCYVLAPERVEQDLQKLHEILDYVLAQDPFANIHIARGPEDNELMVRVTCKDRVIADKINFAQETSKGGIWFGAMKANEAVEGRARSKRKTARAARLFDQVQYVFRRLTE